MRKSTVFLKVCIVLFIISGCSSYKQITCRSLFNEGDLAECRSCCERIYDERMRQICLKQLQGLKKKVSSQIAFIEETLLAVHQKLEKGDHESARTMLGKIRDVAPEYMAEVRDIEGRIKHRRRLALQRRYENYNQSYTACMRRKDYNNAVRAVAKAIEIARQNLFPGFDLPGMEAMHKKAAKYRVYTLIVNRYEELMQGARGEYPVRGYRKALFEAQIALDIVEANPVLLAEKTVSKERVLLVKEKIEKAVLVDKERQNIAGQP